MQATGFLLELLLKSVGKFSLENFNVHGRIESAAQIQRHALVDLGFLVMGLSALLITNTLAALLNQQEHQIGVMKTLGARRGQIVSIYMLLIFVYGIAAFFLALPLSSRVAYLLLEGFASAINMVLQGYRIVPLAIILQVVIALVVPQSAGIGPILHGTRISAVEALSGYKVFLHGEAVAVGMAAAARLAEAMGLIPAEQRGRIVSLLSQAGLPVKMPSSIDLADVIASMRQDKKALAGRLTFVLPVEIGAVKIFNDISENMVRDVLFSQKY